MTKPFEGQVRCFALAAGMLIGSAGGAAAAPMLFTLHGVSDDDLSATVLFSYAGLTESTGVVQVTLSNTSSAFQPRLTAFAFNLPDAVLGVDGFTTSLARWRQEVARDDVHAPGHLGFFDVAALTGPNFTGGSPGKGLATDATAHFAFNLTGAGMLGLTEASFLSLGSHAGAAPTAFAARFQQVGAAGDQSDVATPSGPPTASVSEPTTLLLTGLGFLALANLHRRQAA